MKFPRSKYLVLPLVLRDFCFWAIWAAGPVLKKKLGANYEQLLRAFFSCFRGQIFFLNFFVNPIASKLKSCIIDLKKLNFLNFSWISFWNKTDFFRAAQILKLECTLKRSPIAGQADALSITPQGPLYKYVKSNDIYIVYSFKVLQSNLTICPDLKKSVLFQKKFKKNSKIFIFLNLLCNFLV